MTTERVPEAATWVKGTVVLSGNRIKLQRYYTFTGSDAIGIIVQAKHVAVPANISIVDNRIEFALPSKPRTEPGPGGMGFRGIALFDLNTASTTPEDLANVAVLVQGNTIWSSTPFPPYHGIELRIHHTTVAGNDLSGLTAARTQLALQGGAQSTCNVIRNNVFGRLGTGSGYAVEPLAGAWINGDHHQFVDNDFTHSEILGWELSPHVGCVLLDASSFDNTVVEPGSFPPGTGGAAHQCLDLGTSNRVVGLPANGLIDPGIGDLVREQAEALEALLGETAEVVYE